MSDLTTLRGEVEALREGSMGWLRAAPPDMRASVLARRQALKEVLDLIDKHAREGQPDANH